MAAIPERAGDHIFSPQDLYDYIRVNNPRMWTILLALFFLSFAGLFWIFTAVIPLSVSVNVRRIGPGRYIAFVSPELGAELEPKTAVRIGRRQGEIVSVDPSPLSRQEAARLLREDFHLSGDYALYALGLGEWNVALTLSVPDGEEGAGAFEQAVISFARLRPLDFFQR
jgi:hypothetical protein